jgi:L-alanine-DL-glutamate epimerase-like enolase superfamily enzyme
MSIYPEYKAQRSLFQPDPGKLGGFTVEISTDKGVKGYGEGGTAGGEIVEQHLVKLLLNEDPFNIERINNSSTAVPPGTYCGDPRCTTAAPVR